MDVIELTREGGGASEQMEKRSFKPLEKMFRSAWKGKPVAHKRWGSKRELFLFRVFTIPVGKPWDYDHTVPTDWYYLSLRWDRDDCLGGAPINSAARAKQRFDELCVEMMSYVIAPGELPEGLLD